MNNMVVNELSFIMEQYCVQINCIYLGIYIVYNSHNQTSTGLQCYFVIIENIEIKRHVSRM